MVYANKISVTKIRSGSEEEWMWVGTVIRSPLWKSRFEEKLEGRNWNNIKVYSCFKIVNSMENYSLKFKGNDIRKYEEKG